MEFRVVAQTFQNRFGSGFCIRWRNSGCQIFGFYRIYFILQILPFFKSPFRVPPKSKIIVKSWCLFRILLVTDSDCPWENTVRFYGFVRFLIVWAFGEAEIGFRLSYISQKKWAWPVCNSILANFPGVLSICFVRTVGILRLRNAINSLKKGSLIISGYRPKFLDNEILLASIENKLTIWSLFLRFNSFF